MTRHTAPRREAPASAKREQMLERALDVFVANGYVGTTTDQLAAAASVSKQTLYKTFGDKQGVFAALIHFACDRVEDPFAPLVERMRTVPSAQDGVGLLAVQLAGAILTPRIQRLRRLVIAEATRFPDLAQVYWERGFAQTIGSVARCLAILDERGLLAVPDPTLAAHHLAGMLLWIPGNRAMFAPTAPMSAADVDPAVAAGSAAFLRAYRPSPRLLRSRRLRH